MKTALIIILHLTFWIVYWLLALMFSYNMDEGHKMLNGSSLPLWINFLWAATAFYWAYLRLYKFFEQRKYFFYALYVALVSVFISAFFYLLYKYVFIYDSEVLSILFFIPTIGGTFIIANCGSLIRGFVNWIDEMQVRADLEKSKVQHELDSLKSQLNPHFLFNTLNNIDSLIFRNKEQASESLIKLSEILQYMLYDTEQPKVLLTKEVEHIQNIISLQQLRYSQNNYIRFNCSDIEDCYVSPLLFTPFVENAFKHSSQQGDLPVVDMSLTSNDEVISFSCSNQYNSTEIKNSQKGGIGLKNVRRRLEILYQGKYNLSITDKNNTFQVKLYIYLT